MVYALCFFYFAIDVVCCFTIHQKQEMAGVDEWTRWMVVFYDWTIGHSIDIDVGSHRS